MRLILAETIVAIIRVHTDWETGVLITRARMAIEGVSSPPVYVLLEFRDGVCNNKNRTWMGLKLRSPSAERFFG